MTTPQDELRAAVEVLRHPCQCMPKAGLIADHLEAVENYWPDYVAYSGTSSLAAVRRTALELARALNGSQP